MEPVTDPLLQSARFTIEKFSPEEFDSFLRLVRNERVMEKITGSPLSMEAARAKFHKILEHEIRYPALGCFKAMAIEDGAFMGYGKLEIRDNNPDEAEIGYLFFPEYWGKGYGSELTHVLVEYARAQQLRRLYGIIDPGNAASRRILEKLGFVSEGPCEMDGIQGEMLGLIL